MVTVYEPEGYCLNVRKPVTVAPGEEVIDVEMMPTVLPAGFFTTPCKIAVKATLPVFV